MKYYLVIPLILLLIVLPIVSSAPPVSETVQRGVDIVHPDTLYVKLGDNFEINFWTYQSLDGQTLTNSSLNCTVYLIDDKGVNFFRASNQAGASALIRYGKGSPLCSNCWTTIVGAGNLSTGVYSYQLKCQGLDLTTPTALRVGGYEVGGFEVTPSGMGDDRNFFIFIIL